MASVSAGTGHYETHMRPRGRDADLKLSKDEAPNAAVYLYIMARSARL